jgi:TctA family transporter
MQWKESGQRSNRFGNGAIEGITPALKRPTTPPLRGFCPLSLGIPGDAVMALMLGALIIRGIQPVPCSLTQQPVFWGLIVKLRYQQHHAVDFEPAVDRRVGGDSAHSLSRSVSGRPLCLSAWVLYSVNNNTFDILHGQPSSVLLIFLAVLKFEAAPLLLGFLGPLMEENLRRALLVSW